MLIQTNGPLRSLLALMLPCLAKTRKEEKDERVISLGLHIIRNLLSVKDAVASDTTTGQKEEMSRMQVSSLQMDRADRQSNLISQLHKLTYFQLFLTLASLAEQTQINQYNVLILDILHLVYRGVRPKDLVRDQARVRISYGIPELEADKQGPMDQLASLLEAERKTKALGSKNLSTRHSRFGTTIKVQAVSPFLQSFGH
jgi:replication fork protection complex subunit Tof1/Swi1